MSQQAPARAAAFKNRGQTADDSRARRIETTVELRKEKRDKHLVKRRHLANESAGVEDEATDGIAHEPSGVTLEHMVEDCASADPQVLLRGVMNLRKLLSKSPEPLTIDSIIRAGVVPRLVACLSAYNNALLQYEAAWAITNIASGTSEHARAVVESGAVPPLVQLSTSQNLDACEQAAWALGNIAGDNPSFRDLVLNSGGLPPILQILTQSTRTELTRTATWTLLNLCRGRNPEPNFNTLKASLPVLARLIWVEDDNQVVADAVLALSFLSDGPNEKIHAIIEAGVCKRLCDLLMINQSEAVVYGVLRTLTNITGGQQYETQVVVNAGALPSLLHLLSQRSEKVRKQTCYVLSNIMAGTTDQLQAVIDTGIVSPLAECVASDEFSVRKEACWALTNGISSGTDKQVRELCNVSLGDICTMLAWPELDLDLMLQTLEAIERGLSLGQQLAEMTDQENLFAHMVEESGAIQYIEQLQHHQNTRVYNHAWKIISHYFAQEEPMHMADGASGSVAMPLTFGNVPLPEGGFRF